MQDLKISEVSKKENAYKALSLIFGIVLFGIGVLNMKINYIIIGILLMFYFTYYKTIYLTNTGIEYRYKGLLFNRKECLNFSGVDEITIVKGKTETSIFIIREPMAKKVVVINDRINEIIKHLKDNSSVPITYK